MMRHAFLVLCLFLTPASAAEVVLPLSGNWEKAEIGYRKVDGDRVCEISVHDGRVNIAYREGEWTAFEGFIPYTDDPNDMLEAFADQQTLDIFLAFRYICGLPVGTLL